MNGEDETRHAGPGQIPPARPSNVPPPTRAESIFFNDDAIDEASRRQFDVGRAGERPVVRDQYYDDQGGYDSYDDGRGGVFGGSGGGYDDGYYDEPDPTGNRPRVLANTASEWDVSYQEEVDVRTGPNRILVFALAALVAALLGVGFAIFSVLSGGDDETDTTTAEGTDDSTLDPVAAGDDASTTTTPLETTTTLDPATTLDISLDSATFVCDDTARQFGTITGAAPNEEVVFTSPQSSGILPGQADETGSLPIRWICSADQVGTTWELTATGSTSGKTGTVSFTGTDTQAETGAGTDTDLSPLVVDVFENPFNCDDSVRAFATISGADPNAVIEFSSPQSSGLSPGNADADGQLDVRWSCTPDQIGTTWELTATEQATGRAVTFEFVGA